MGYHEKFKRTSLGWADPSFREPASPCAPSSASLSSAAKEKKRVIWIEAIAIFKFWIFAVTL
jgi:hypothetical protein